MPFSHSHLRLHVNSVFFPSAWNRKTQIFVVATVAVVGSLFSDVGFCNGCLGEFGDVYLLINGLLEVLIDIDSLEVVWDTA
jgi:hypothetical protein